MSQEELEAFINDVLEAYTAMTLGVKEPPKWRWTSRVTISYSIPDKTIYIHEALKDAWKLDRRLTERFLRWSLAHEFTHYVQDVRGISVLELVKVPIIEFPWISEYLATKKATMLSGITKMEGDVLTTQVLTLLAKHGLLK